MHHIVSLFESSPSLSYNYKQVSKQIGVESQVDKLHVASILEDMALGGYLKEIDRGRSQLNHKGVVVTGTFVRRSNGKNSFLPGEVVEILESKERTFVGRLQVEKGFAFLITEDKTLANDIFIPKRQLRGGKNGDKAIVRIVEWPEDAKNPLGEVVDILGQAGENDTEMHAILAEFGLPYKYPENVEKAADRIPDVIPDEEIALVTQESEGCVVRFKIIELVGEWIGALG